MASKYIAPINCEIFFKEYLNYSITIGEVVRKLRNKNLCSCNYNKVCFRISVDDVNNIDIANELTKNKELKHFNNIHFDTFRYKDYIVDFNYDCIKEYLDELDIVNKEIEDYNSKILKEQEKIFDDLVKHIKSLNVSTTEYYYHSKRSLNKKERIAVWYVELRNKMVIPSKRINYKEISRTKLEYIKEITSLIAEKKLKTEKEIKNAKLTVHLSKLCEKYNEEFIYEESLMLNAEVLLEILTKKDKYLKLAHSLYACRSNFSNFDGIDQVVGSFVVENSLDEEIKNELLETIEKWDGDGRIFRDIMYSYDFIFNLVNKDIMTDYQFLIDNFDLFY